MRNLFTVLGFIAAIVGLAMSILPLGSLAIIPIVLAFVLGLLSFRAAKNENKSRSLVKLMFIIIIAALVLSVYKIIFDENIIVEDQETIERDKRSEEEAIKELDSIIIDE